MFSASILVIRGDQILGSIFVHRGGLSCESEVGAESTFVVTLPLDRPSPEPTHA